MILIYIMVTLADRQYTLEDFNKIIYIGNIPPLSLSIINKIKQLAQKVGAPSYNKTPNFKKNRRNRVKYGSENWENIRNFTATKIERATPKIKPMYTTWRAIFALNSRLVMSVTRKLKG